MAASRSGVAAIVAAAVAFALLLLSTACRDQSTTSGNVVQVEMRLLTAALHTAVDGIGAGDVREIEHALHRVHEARGETEKALHDGSYRPPKNPQGLERFAELDGAFHSELELLVRASRANDVGAAATALGRAAQRCQECHREFRP